MIMARRGTHEFFGFSMVGVFFAVLLFSLNCWAQPLTECDTYNRNGPSNANDCTEDTRWVWNRFYPSGCQSYGSSCGSGPYDYCCDMTTCQSGRTIWIVCPGQCALDRYNCEQDSTKIWVPNDVCGECREQCEEEECAEGEQWDPDSCKCVADICASDRIECRNAGGSWSGAPDGDCCSSVCDLCNSESVDRLFEQKKRECCAQLKAPPGRAEMCLTPLQSGCGMTTSTLSDDNNEFKCRDPNLGGDAHDSYFLNCSGSSSSTEQSSSSYECEGDTCQAPPGPGSSSSECEGDTCQTPPPVPGSSSDGVNSSDSFGPGSSDDGSGCPECGLLEDIRDTLHYIHVSVNDIYSCISSPYLCNSSSTESNPFRFDTAFRFYLEPIMDSALKLDNQQLKALLRLDTNQLKMLKVDSVALRNDTLLGYKVDALGNVIDTSIHSLNDSTRNWFKRIADSIGVSTDSLIAHLDSIVRNIPDSILDSIVKYQAYANDNLDSVLYGKGKGFSLVDSLIDSTVKYFKRATYYDSVYSLIFSDSIGNTNSLIDGLPSRNASAISRALGYGDTASTDLRGDLNGIREAIEGLGDGIGSGVAGALDSAMGSGSGADTSGTSYDWISRGDALADSILEGSGFAGYDFAGDSLLRDSLDKAGFVCNDTSCCVGDECFTFESEQSIRDSLTRFVLDYGDTLRRKNQDFYDDSVTSMFQAVKDSLMVWNPVGVFDSTVLSTLGMKIPNTNTCPENCSTFQVDIPFLFGTQHFNIDYGLCLGRTVFAGGNVLSFLRFIIRIIIAWTCISAVMWNAARMKR